jgi:hypothetical protein
MRTPIVRLYHGKLDLPFYTLEDFKKYQRDHPCYKGDVKYFKGLGTNSNKEIENSFGQKMIEFVADERTDETMDKVFHSKCSDQRKAWLEEYDPSIDIEIVGKQAVQMLPISDFLDLEMIKFSIDDCKRSIPTMIDGLKENDFFPTPIVTPSTKAAEGHDEDISKDEIIKQGLASLAEWNQLENYALQLFERGKAIAAKQGLILADTKYEFGKIGDTIYLMDEIHTPDSSRYFYADGFEERQQKGERQKQLSKEFVREWLIENNFMGKENQTVPAMSDEWVNTISLRYIELYEKVIGEKFVPEPLTEEATQQKIKEALYPLL